MIITQEEYDQLYEKVKKDVLRDLEEQKSKSPFKKEYSVFVSSLEDRIRQYSDDTPKIYAMKSSIYVLTRVALDLNRFEELKNIGVKDAKAFTDEIFDVIERHKEKQEAI